MRFLDKLERKYGRYAIHNLMQYIVFAGAVVFIFDYGTGGRLSSQLTLIPGFVMQGQVWRMITFLGIPPTKSLIFAIFVFLFYYRMGLTLEHEWGSFKFNVYYFLGVILIIVSSFAIYFLTGISVVATSAYLNLTLFFAFATLYPNQVIRLYMILPIKIKYLAYISAGFTLFAFLMGTMSTKISILAGVGNYLIFFGRDLIKSRANRAKSAVRMNNYRKGMESATEHRHKCHVCGRTELDDPDLEFRYCSKCDGYYEYCLDHLKNHEHVRGEE